MPVTVYSSFGNRETCLLDRPVSRFLCGAGNRGKGRETGGRQNGEDQHSHLHARQTAAAYGPDSRFRRVHFANAR